MKLVSVNIEGLKHIARVEAFLKNTGADIICLQEAPSLFCEQLRSMGHVAEFLPMTLKHAPDGSLYEEGLILATRLSASFASFYYFQPDKQLRMYDKDNCRGTYAQGVLLAEVQDNGKVYPVATTHFTWSQDGSVPSKGQLEDIETFVKKISHLPPHIMCGDFNIPRHYNALYKDLTAVYQDGIPPEYTSSLDASLHKCGQQPDKSILFESYMVDYVFTTQPFAVADVKLKFGVSDHAAVVATILPLQT